MSLAALSLDKKMADIPPLSLGAVSFLEVFFFIPQTSQDEAERPGGASGLYSSDCLHRLCCSNHLQHNLDHFHNYLPEHGTVLRSYRSNRAISGP